MVGFLPLPLARAARETGKTMLEVDELNRWRESEKCDQGTTYFFERGRPLCVGVRLGSRRRAESTAIRIYGNTSSGLPPGSTADHTSTSTRANCPSRPFDRGCCAR